MFSMFDYIFRKNPPITNKMAAILDLCICLAGMLARLAAIHIYIYFLVSQFVNVKFSHHHSKDIHVLVNML